MNGKELKAFAEVVPKGATVEVQTEDNEWRELEAAEVRFSATAQDVIEEDLE